MIFSYTAKSKNGEIFEGMLEAADRFQAARELKARGHVPISISEKRQNFSDFFASAQGFLRKVSGEELIIMTKNLSGMLRAGLSLDRALSVLQKQNKNSKFSKILVSLKSDINSGETFSTALLKFPNVFSKLFIALVRAGEESGNLAGALEDVHINLEKSYNLNKKIKGALIYPSIVLSAMISIGILMFAFVVPALANAFNQLGAPLPLSTRVLILIGAFFSEYWILSFLVIIVFVLGIVLLVRMRLMARYFDYLILHLPIIGNLVKEVNTIHTARTMSSLLPSGIPISRAIDITEDVVQNIYYKKVLRDAKKMIENGAPFSKAFEANPELYPIMMSEMIQVGEETGKLSNMLLDVALFYEEDIENKTKNILTVIEPVLIIVVGAGVGFFAVSMISPLYTILDYIN